MSKTKAAPIKITRGQTQAALDAGLTHANFFNKGVQRRLLKNQEKIKRAQQLRENMIRKSNKRVPPQKVEVSHNVAASTQARPFDGILDENAIGNDPVCTIDTGSGSVADAATEAIRSGLVANMRESLQETAKDKPRTSMYAGIAAALRPVGTIAVDVETEAFGEPVTELAAAINSDAKVMQLESVGVIHDHRTGAAGTVMAVAQSQALSSFAVQDSLKQQGLCKDMTSMVDGMARGERIRQAGVTVIEEDGTSPDMQMRSLTADFLSATALSPFQGSVAPNRRQMFADHPMDEILMPPADHDGITERVPSGASRLQVQPTGLSRLGEDIVGKHTELLDQIGEMISRPVEESITEDQARQANQLDALNPPVLDNLCEKMHNKIVAEEEVRYGTTFESESGSEEQ